MREPLDVRAKRVFDEAIDLSSVDRLRHLDSACADAPELRARVDTLLAAAEKQDSFLSDPTLNALPAPSALAGAEQPGSQIGPYILVKLLGEGGFGSVFLAEQATPVRRQVALKIIKAGMDTKQVIARFEAERQTLALLDHPNIARVLDAGATAGGRPYFVMELVDGETVTNFCDRERLSVPQRLALFRQICGAIQYAHQKGIIHRDLKPSNVLITVVDGAPRAKVIDFGIAKVTAAQPNGRTFTALHQLIGTPEYMSPEQAAVSADIDTRSDIYSLGVLLFELLTGTTPFDRAKLSGSGLDGMRRILREEEPLRPSLRLRSPASSSSASQLPIHASAAGSSVNQIAVRRQTAPALLVRALRRDLDWIVLKCLEKDRAQRYETASALADDIARCIDDQPVSATPPSAGYRLRKFVRRNRVVVLAGAAIAAALILGVIGTSLGLIRAMQEQRRAELEADQARAINDFMRQVLTSVEPQKRGADVRLLEVIASASESATQRFADHPLLEAQVRDLLGEVNNNLGLWQAAAAEFRRAAALNLDFAGINDPRTLRAEYLYLTALLNLHQTNEAEEVFAALMPRLRRVLGEDHRITLDARRCEAVIHKLRGRLDEAEQILLELRSHPRLMDDDYARFRILNALILVRQASPGDTDREISPNVWQEIAELCQERVELAMRLYGPQGAETAHTRLKLAENQYKLGHYAQSADECRAILAESADRLGECHDFRAGAMIELATALGRLGEEHEPAELYLRGIACRRANYPVVSIPLLGALSDSLHYLARGGKFAEGEAISREVIAMLGNFGGGHGDMLVTAQMYLAQFVSMAGRLEEADELFATLFANENTIPNLYAKARLHLCYGDHLMRCGQFERAEAHLERATDIRGDVREGTWPDLPDDIILGFMRLYEAWGRAEKTEEYRRLRNECE